MSVHPTAIVSHKAEIDSDVEIGPYAVIGDDVQIASGTVIHHHVTITGWTRIGTGNEFFPGAVIGTAPQDLKYKGEKTFLEIGDNNIFREYVTVNTGTEHGGRITRVGNTNLVMAYCHIAHDCQVGSNTVLANGAMLGGHVIVEDNVWFGGMVGVHHFVTVGRFAFIGGMSRLSMDVPPFMLVEGNPARVRGVNAVGLRRNGFSIERIESLKFACQKLFRNEGRLTEAMEAIRESKHYTEDVEYLLNAVSRTEKGRYGRAQESERSR